VTPSRQKITALGIVLTMTSILSACAAEDDTGREPMRGIPDDETGVDAKLPTSEAPIGNALSTRRFVSIEKQEAGLGPDGAEVGHWFIDFSTSTFEWAYSDVSESGTYVLIGKEVIGHSGGREFHGEYDPDSGILTWDGVEYRLVNAAK